MNLVMKILGGITLILGIIGIFLPLLPTTPFLLLTAFLWVKSSDRLYFWLMNHKYLGNYIRNFREHKAIPLRAKVVSVTLVFATIGWCIFFVVTEWLWAQIGLSILAIAISWHILSFKTLEKKDNE